MLQITSGFILAKNVLGIRCTLKMPVLELFAIYKNVTMQKLNNTGTNIVNRNSTNVALLLTTFSECPMK